MGFALHDHADALGVIVPHPHVLTRNDRAVAASPLGVKPRQLNPEIR
jgi:hypothetical protein